MSRARIGTVEQDYHFDAVLGEGGFGTVYRVHRPGEEDRAIKVLHADHMSVPQLVARFEREIATIRSLKHPSGLEIYESGRLADGSPFFVMELLHGEDLKEKLARDGRMSLEQAVAILEPVCDVLQLAHERSIVHRDIKASNIFLCSGGRVVLLDFGIAKFVGIPGMTLTMSRQLIGTPSAMSPEQLRGEEIDARTDVYALGALSYHMLTGSRVFTGSSASVVQHMHKHAARPRPSDRAPVGFAVDRLLLSAMAIDAERRPADAGAFLRELQAAARGGKSARDGEGQAVVVFGRLLAAPKGAAEADQSLRRVHALLLRLEAAGFELLSRHSRGFVCAQLLVEGREDAQRTEIRSLLDELSRELDGDAPAELALWSREGVVTLSGELMCAGEVLVPPSATPESVAT